MRVFNRTLVLSLAVASLFLSGLGAAQTLPGASPDEAVLDSYRVRIAAENQIASVLIEQTYSNPTDRVLEETYVFPVPKGVTITSLTLCQGDDSCTEGQLLEAGQARSIYEEIVRRTRDPALLEYINDRSFQVKIFPILPGQKQTVKIRYQLVLTRQNDLLEVLYPITSQKEIGQMLIELNLKNDQPIGNIYSPSHGLSITRVSEHEVKASYEASHLKSDEDFRVYYAVAQNGIALDLISYQPTGEDGYFLMLLSWPKLEAQPLPKEIVFVLDTSGSMNGEKLAQAKESLRVAIGRLSAADSIGIITFSDTVREYKSELIRADQLDKGDLSQFVNALEAAGGTNIHSALLRGLDLFDETSERPKMVVFLTDGLPTAGETDISKILNDFETGNKKLSGRIFTFGVGYDVNTILLDTLSSENGGFTTYVEPGENLESAVARFYDRVGTPLIWGLSSTFEGLNIYDLYPVALPDLFEGDMLEVVGRYRAGGSGTLTLSGQGQGQAGTFSHPIELASGLTEHDYLPKLWAARSIGYLLTQIRLHGSTPELVDRVRQLGEKFGIVTPYTSYLAVPDQQDSSGLFNLQSQPPSGQGAVQASEALNIMSKAASADELDQFYATAEKRLGDRTFQLRDGRWIDAGAAQAKADVVVEFGSEAYFALANDPELREMLQLGSRMLFTVKSEDGSPVAIEIADTGIQAAGELPAALKQMTQSAVLQTGDDNNSGQSNDSNSQSTTQSSSQPDAAASGALSWATIAVVAAVLAVLAAAWYWLLRR